VDIHNSKGEVTGQIELAADVFGVPFNEAVVHQAVVRQLANRRLGTADTKTRGEVSGSSRKLYAQKHTGRARSGDVSSPLRRHGGIVFGPHPRSYRQAMPRKMRRLALRCALSAKASDGEMRILDRLELAGPKTKEMLGILEALGAAKSAIVAIAAVDANAVKSARNLPGIKMTPVNLLNVADLLSYKSLVMTADAVRRAEELWGEKASEEKVSSAR